MCFIIYTILFLVFNSDLDFNNHYVKFPEYDENIIFKDNEQTGKTSKCSQKNKQDEQNKNIEYPKIQKMMDKKVISQSIKPYLTKNFK